MSHIIEKLLNHNIFIVLISGEEIYGTLLDADDVWLQVGFVKKKTFRKITKIINLCMIESIELNSEFDNNPENKKFEKNIQMTTLR